MKNVQLQINELAKRASVTIRTVRFYEEKNLLQPSAYTSGGIRLYTVQDVNRLVFIRRLVKLGVTLKEIKQYLDQLSETTNHKLRAEHTLKLLQIQNERLADEQAKINQLEEDIHKSMEKVTRCLNCQSAPCSEKCPSYGQVL